MWITVYGVAALTFMMAMYALEGRGPRFVGLFALGCVLSSVYGFASGAWPFGVVELVWAVVAVRRWVDVRARADLAVLGADAPSRHESLAPPADAPAEGEDTTVLFDRDGVRIEHILTGTVDPEEIYDQDHDEWVLVHAGAATVEVAEEPVRLVSGDWLLLPARTRHRVTAADPGTSWLAVHLPPPPEIA